MLREREGKGKLAATVLGIPLSVLFWFILGFEKKPIWEGTGLLKNHR